MTEWQSDRVTKWPSDQVTEWPSDKWPSDQVTQWQEASQTIDRMVYLDIYLHLTFEHSLCVVAQVFKDLFLCHGPEGRTWVVCTSWRSLHSVFWSTNWLTVAVDRRTSKTTYDSYDPSLMMNWCEKSILRPGAQVHGVPSLKSNFLQLSPKAPAHACRLKIWENHD